MKIFKIFFLILIFAAATFAQDNFDRSIELTGNLYADSKIISGTYPELNKNPMADDLPGKKSPVLSGILSAILPGAGQVYNEDWWIAGVFVAVEAALITTAITYDNKGDDQTAYFENFADENWSVVKYAKWLNEKGASITIDETTPGLKDWERVNWNELNAAEKSNLPGVISSHPLAPHGEQQYYELIGKYHQYIPGWPGGTDQNTPPQIMLDYSQMRGQANDYYNNASTAVIGIYINHILSAAEAVWGATRFNNNLAVNFRVEPYNTATGTELVPTLNVKFSF